MVLYTKVLKPPIHPSFLIQFTQLWTLSFNKPEFLKYNKMNIVSKIESEQFKSELKPFNVGDTVKVHTRVVEGDKERIQVYSGIVIGRKGTGINENFTVRRVSYGEGVERVFPIHSPRIAKIEVERKGAVRRAKLNYLRSRKGKSATTVKDQVDRS